MNCAVKVAQSHNQSFYNAVVEARLLAISQCCKYLPYVFGIISTTNLFMEMIFDNNDEAVRVYEIRSEAIVSKNKWLDIYYGIALRMKYMHCKFLFHIDLKTNNIVLKPNVMVSTNN